MIKTVLNCSVAFLLLLDLFSACIWQQIIVLSSVVGCMVCFWILVYKFITKCVCVLLLNRCLIRWFNFSNRRFNRLKTCNALQKVDVIVIPFNFFKKTTSCWSRSIRWIKGTTQNNQLWTAFNPPHNCIQFVSQASTIHSVHRIIYCNLVYLYTCIG